MLPQPSGSEARQSSAQDDDFHGGTFAPRPSVEHPDPRGSPASRSRSYSAGGRIGARCSSSRFVGRRHVSWPEEVVMEPNEHAQGQERRIAKPLGRAMGRFDEDPTSARRAMSVLVVAVATTVVLGGVVMWLVDRREYPDLGVAFWYVLQTVTTVGYGDVAPSDPVGRSVGGLIMVLAFAYPGHRDRLDHFGLHRVASEGPAPAITDRRGRSSGPPRGAVRASPCPTGRHRASLGQRCRAVSPSRDRGSSGPLTGLDKKGRPRSPAARGRSRLRGPEPLRELDQRQLAHLDEPILGPVEVDDERDHRTEGQDQH